jgi:3-dehydroquinate synthase
LSRLFAARGALAKGTWAAPFRKKRVALVGDATTLRLFSGAAKRGLRGSSVQVFRLPEGEKAKTWPAVQALMGAMLNAGFGRDSAVAALGGGAVTDAAGFAASIYLRGVPWASLPTTVVGQLDSGIGGKTAINLPEGKNLAGAFHDPAVIVCDPEVLRTLPARERVSGLAEAVKTAWLFDPKLWRTMERGWEDLAAGEGPLLERVVRACAAWKLRVVAEDPRERTGRRELLNLGHTLGHAIEKAAGYERLRHGEAVIWGLRAMLRLSVKHAGMGVREAMNLEDFLAGVPIPDVKGLSAKSIVSLARRDKKGRSRFILLKAVGRPVAVDGVDEEDVLRVVKELL